MSQPERLKCDDCGYTCRYTPEREASLPEHGCAQRQGARRRLAEDFARQEEIHQGEIEEVADLLPDSTPAQLQPTPGRHVTRRLEEPRGIGQGPRRHEPGVAAQTMVAAHNEAVRRYGSDCGGFHAFHVPTLSTGGVWTDRFPQDTVITRMSWGRIDASLAQRMLEGDRWIAEDGSVQSR